MVNGKKNLKKYRKRKLTREPFGFRDSDFRFFGSIFDSTLTKKKEFPAELLF